MIVIMNNTHRMLIRSKYVFFVFLIYFVGACIVNVAHASEVIDQEKICGYLENAAKVGDPYSEQAYGDCVRKGVGRPKNIRLAEDLYKKAIKGGVVIAKISLVSLYLFNFHDEQKKRLAVDLLREPISKGYSGDGRTITYTSFNKADSISKGGQTTRFDYGVDHFRTRQISPGATTVYINPRLDKGAHYEQETRNGQIEDKHYIYGGSGLVAVYTQKHPVSQPTSVTASTRYLHTDHLGSIVAISDEAGQTVEAFGYSPFGARRNAGGTDPVGILTSAITHQGYTGHEMLDDFGLIHANARLYDPKLGRFLNADPTIQFADNLQSYNRYSYVLNNPLSFTDPSGLGIFSKLKKAFKKLFKKKLFRIIAAIAVGAITGFAVSSFLRGLFIPGGLVTGAAAGGFAAGFTGGLILTGGDVNASLKLGAAGALTAGALQAFGGSGFLTRVAGNGVAGGTSSKFLGGSFQRGAILAALTVSASELVTRVTKTRPTFRTAQGGARVKPSDALIKATKGGCNTLRCDVIDSLSPNVGRSFLAGPKQANLVGRLVSGLSKAEFNSLTQTPGYFTGETGFLGTLAKLVPGLNSSAVLHDAAYGQFQRAVGLSQGGILDGILLPTTIPAVFAGNVVALGIPQLVDDVQLIANDN